jgi:Uma2 family endonuclease
MGIGVKQVLDYDDYVAIPPDGRRWELLEGDVHVSPAPAPFHQWSSKKLQRQLEAYFEERGLGRVFDAPIDVILTRHDVVQPDLAVVTDAGQISRRGIEGAPALIVEVLSPGTAEYDRSAKARRYAALGLPHFCLLDPERRRLECFRLEGQAWQLVAEGAGDGVIEHPDWPGLVIRLGDLWL